MQSRIFFDEKRGHPERSEGPLKISKIMRIGENLNLALGALTLC